MKISEVARRKIAPGKFAETVRNLEADLFLVAQGFRERGGRWELVVRLETLAETLETCVEGE